MKQLFLLPLLLAGVVPTGTTSLLSTPAQAAPVDEDVDKDVEEADHSRLTTVKLPAGAYRTTNKADLAKFTDALQKMAQTSHRIVNKTEVLIWRDGNISKAMKSLPERLEGADYKYAAKEPFESEAGRITLFNASHNEKSDCLTGMWVETKNDDGKFGLLVWGLCQPASGDKAEPAKSEDVKPEVKDEDAPPANKVEEIVPSHPTPKPDVVVEPPAPKGSGEVPADLLGKTWSWTTISGVGYRDTTTGQLASPSGMSAKFKFTADGKYDYFFFISQRTYNLVNQATTTHQGKVVFNGDGSFTLYPAKGHYNGSMGTKPIDRPMSESERKPMTFSYEWRTENGKRQLYIGPTKRSLSLFKPAEQ